MQQRTTRTERNVISNSIPLAHAGIQVTQRWRPSHHAPDRRTNATSRKSLQSNRTAMAGIWSPSRGSSGAFKHRRPLHPRNRRHARPRNIRPQQMARQSNASWKCHFQKNHLRKIYPRSPQLRDIVKIAQFIRLETILSMESYTSCQKFDGLATCLRSPTARGSRLSTFVSL